MIDTIVDPSRIVLAVLVAAVLLGLVPFVLRRLRPTMKVASLAEEEVSIVAQRTLDMRHRIVVVRHRGLEHLLVLGGSLPVVVGQSDINLPNDPSRS